MKSKIVKILAGLFVLLSHKSLPLAWTFRFYYHLVRRLVVPKLYKKLWPNSVVKPSTPLAIFAPSIFKTFNSLLECDVFLHKSNSTYFAELDIARTKLILTVLFEGIEQHKKKTGSYPYLPVAAVQATFKKEIKPLERYDVISRILCWDEKWLFVLSKFVLPQQKGRTSCVAITKYVMKQGRKTVVPKELMESCGLWSEETEIISKDNYKIVRDFVDTGVVQDVDMDSPRVV